MSEAIGETVFAKRSQQVVLFSRCRMDGGPRTGTAHRRRSGALAAGALETWTLLRRGPGQSKSGRVSC